MDAIHITYDHRVYHTVHGFGTVIAWANNQRTIGGYTRIHFHGQPTTKFVKISELVDFDTRVPLK